ncbi:MAG: glycoside hydrolase family 31 protein [Candidatus Freyarchaeota archaeon]|nr:glycoside hydrolase family 31 protein [Candidatus Jordarchaeia archaeon]
MRGEWRSIGRIERYEINDGILLLDCGDLGAEVKIVGSNVLRVRLITPDEAPRSSWVVRESESALKFEFNDEGEYLVVSTEKLSLNIRRNPCRLEFYDHDGWMINRDDLGKGMGWDGEQVRCWKEMPENEHYFGFGEKAGSLDKRDQALTMWNTDNVYHYTPTDPLYGSVPFFMALREGRSYGIFLNNTHRSSFDMGKESSHYYSFGAERGPLEYYFIYGPKPKEVLFYYTELTGKPFLPPLWSLGYHQCRWSYYPESRVREVASELRKRRIPCDAIWLDIDYMDGFRVFTWNKERFPNPKKMIEELRRDGFKTVVIVDPGVKVDEGYRVYEEGKSQGHFVRLPSGELFMGDVWPGACHFPDFASSKAREWWGSLFKELLDVGVAGIWLDMNEPSVFFKNTIQLDAVHNADGRLTDHREIHNAYGLLMAKATYEGLLRIQPDRRPFILTRSFFAGIQRYAAVWTGDNESSWEHLRLSIPMCLNMGVSGVPFVGVDIGGFRRSPSPELFARWIQIGVFYPFCRNHTMTGTPDQEPWAFGDEVESISRKYIELRYILLPYLYNCFYQSSLTGVPVMRAMFIEFPDDPNVLSGTMDGNISERQFMVGDWLLVAPILYEGAKSRIVYLPKGEWFNFWTNEKISGGLPITVEAPLNVCPLFVRGGAIIPMRSVVQYSDEKPINPLVLSVYPSGTSKVEYYEDDGVSFNHVEGEFLLVEFTCTKNEDSVIFEVSERKGSYNHGARTYELRFNGIETKPAKVLWNGEELKQASVKAPSWEYLKKEKVLVVRIPDRGQRELLEIKMEK